MPVSAVSPQITYVGDNVTTNFATGFRWIEDEDLTVWLDGVLQTQGIDYNVTGTNDFNGGTVIFNVAPGAGVTVFLQRNIQPVDRETDYVEGGPLPSITLDNDFDRIIMMIQELNEFGAMGKVPGGTSWDAEGERIVNVGDPIDDKDAANKEYVDGVASKVKVTTNDTFPDFLAAQLVSLDPAHLVFVITDTGGGNERYDLNLANVAFTDQSTTFSSPVSFNTSLTMLNGQQLFIDDGSAAQPGLAYRSDQDNGLYLAGPDTIGLSTNGTARFIVDGTGLMKAQTPNYENLVLADNDIPNAKYVQDTVTGVIGATNFLELTDTPSDYTGAAGQTVLVNGTEDGLIFQNATFIGLTDTPASYAGAQRRAAIVNAGGTGMEFSGDLWLDNIVNAQGEQVVFFSAAPGVVNYLTIGAGLTGTGPIIRASGSDTDIALRLEAKNNGHVEIINSCLKLYDDDAILLGTNEDFSIVFNGTEGVIDDGTGVIKLGVLTWPSVDGLPGQVIATDGFGTLSFVDNMGGGGGSGFNQFIPMAGATLLAGTNQTVTYDSPNAGGVLVTGDAGLSELQFDLDLVSLTGMAAALTTSDSVPVLDNSAGDVTLRKTWGNVITDLGLLVSGDTILASDVSLTQNLPSQEATDVQGGFDEVYEVFKVENGFENRFDTVFSFDDGTRTFTIQPSGSSYDFWANGRKYTNSGPKTVVIPDTEGRYFFYLNDNNDLLFLTSHDESLLDIHAWIATGYWDAVNNEMIWLADSRHERSMSNDSKVWAYYTFGATLQQGFALGNIITDASGDLDEHAQVSVADGILRNQELRFDIVDNSPQELAPIAIIPLYYREGAAGDIRRIPATSFPVTTTGSGRAAFNEFTGATWQLTEVNNNDFVLTHLIATGNLDNPIIGVVGQAQYPTAGSARNGAIEEITSLILGDLDQFARDWRPIATIIFQTSNGYANTVQSRIRSTDSGDDYIDLRFAGLATGSGGTAVSDHGDLTGLTDDDHPQYLPTNGVRGMLGPLDMGNFSITTVDLVDGRNVSADGTVQDNHIADNTIHFVINDAGTATDEAWSASKIDAELATKIGSVIEDTSPELGGPLISRGFDFNITDAAGTTLYGAVGNLNTTGVFMTYAEGSIPFDPADLVDQAGGITFEALGTTVYGTTALESLKHSTQGGRQVYVDEGGILYSVEPPAPGWSANDSDNGTYNLGTGDSTGPWVEIALDVNTVDDLEIGDRLDVTWTLYFENFTDDKPGIVDIGFSIDGGTVINAQSVSIPEYFDGFKSGAFTTASDAAYTAGTNISLFARRSSSDDSNFNPRIIGGSNTHELFVSVPSEGGGVAPSDHNSLTGLQGGIAGQYFHLTSAEYSDLSNKLTAVIDDGTPQLGGDLDANSNRVILRDTSTIIEPALTFTGDTDTGLLRTGADSVSIVTAGSERFNVAANGALFANTLNYETLVTTDDVIPNKKYVDDSISAVGSHNSLPDLQGGNGTDEYFHLTQGEYLDIGNKITAVVDDPSPQLGGDLDANGNKIINSAGSTSLPSYTVTGDENTGMYFPTGDSIGFSTGGEDRFIVDSSFLGGSGPIGVAAEVKADINKNNIALGLSYSNNFGNQGPAIGFIRSRDSGGSDAILEDGDELFDLIAYGYDGVDYALAAKISCVVNGTPSTTEMPSELIFSTRDIGSFSTERLRIERDGTLSVAASANYETKVTEDGDIPNKKYVDIVKFNAQSGTSYTLVASDLGKTIATSNASDVTISVPEDASVDFPVGAVINILQQGAGQVTVQGLGSAIVVSAETLKLAKQYAAASLIKVTSNQWTLVGYLEAA